MAEYNVVVSSIMERMLIDIVGKETISRLKDNRRDLAYVDWSKKNGHYLKTTPSEKLYLTYAQTVLVVDDSRNQSNDGFIVQTNQHFFLLYSFVVPAPEYIRERYTELSNSKIAYWLYNMTDDAVIKMYLRMKWGF